jgi:hypothetical protein
VETAKEAIKTLPVRSSALGAIDRTAVERTSYDRTYSSSAHEVRVALAAIANLLAPWDFRAVICDLRSNAIYANAQSMVERTREPEVERTAYGRTHVGLRSTAPPAIEHTPDLAAHFIFSINRTLCNFLFPTLGRQVEAPSVAQNLTILHCKHS